MTHKTWSQEEKEFLKNNYLNMSNKELAEKLGRTNSAIQLKISRWGLVRPEKYTYNRGYFDEIDTEEKAYWLGFIYADGCVTKTKVNAELSIELNIKDFNHLKKFNKSIGGNVEVGTRDRFDERTKNTYNMCFIRVYSIEFVDGLLKHGVFPNKHNDIKFPELRKDLVNHFIRGYFDGDGCISVEVRKKIIRCDFSSKAKDFLDSIRDILYNEKIHTYYTLEKSGVNRLCISGMIETDLFLKYIYKDATIYLDRKYSKWKDNHDLLDLDNRLNAIQQKRDNRKARNCLSKQ